MNQHTDNYDEFIKIINTLKVLSQTITNEQRIGLLQQAVQQFGLSAAEADEILKTSGLIVGESVNYFEVLALSVDEFENLDEALISTRVDEAHKKQYSASLQAGGLPRPDGRTQEQWRTVLNQARDTLKAPQKRLEHIAILQTDIRVTPVTGSGSNYPANWSLLSFQCRERAGWKCEECSIDLKLERKFLHAHLLRGTRSINLEDLKALCVGCHAEQPGHQMKHLPYYLEFMDQYGSLWRQLTGR